MEILAPAGSPDALVAAIAGGANAVYLGGKQFGARKFSDNFEDGQLEGAIAYAHDRNVKIYVTVNTLIKDSEMPDVVSYIRFLKNINADAVIIQDTGLLNRISSVEIDKHASTQMGIHSASGLDWCYDNGISRAILAREMTLKEMREAVKGSKIETEVFVQGALCYSMSGGCLFSSMAGGRSGNRGECAQPCRKRYIAQNREGYLLNTRDLYCVDKLNDLKNMGITSIKIEGRMRSPAHSYLTAKVYSLLENGGSTDELEYNTKLLKTIFNRGYGTGYMDGADNVVQTLYPDNRGLFLGTVEVRKNRFNPKDMDINVKDGLSLFSDERKVGGFKVSDMGVSIPFKIKDGTYDIFRTFDPRIDELKNTFPKTPEFTGTTKRPPAGRPATGSPRSPVKSDLSFYVASLKILDAVKGIANRIYFEQNAQLEEAKIVCASAGIELVTILPRFTVSDKKTDGPVMVHNVGQMNSASGTVYGSHHMNMFNSSFLGKVHQMTISEELSRSEIDKVLKAYEGRIEVMIFGRTELMFTRDPEMESGVLKDEKDYVFPVYKTSDGWSHILNSADLFLMDHLDSMEKMGVDSFGIDLRRRPIELAKAMVSFFSGKNDRKKEKLREICGSITYGHYIKGLS